MISLQHIDKRGFIHFVTAPSIEAVERWMAKKNIKGGWAITGKDSVLVSEQYSKKGKGG